MSMKLPVMRGSLRVHFENQEALIFVPEKNETYELNETATKVLKLCDGEHTIEQITDIISNEYNYKSKNVKKDVKDLIKKLEVKRIIQKL